MPRRSGTASDRTGGLPLAVPDAPGAWWRTRSGDADLAAARLERRAADAGPHLQQRPHDAQAVADRAEVGGARPTRVLEARDLFDALAGADRADDDLGLDLEAV